MKRLALLFIAIAAFAVPNVTTGAATASASATPTGLPTAGILPDQMCDQGRGFFAPFIPSLQPGAPALGPLEEAFCGERESFPS